MREDRSGSLLKWDAMVVQRGWERESKQVFNSEGSASTLVGDERAESAESSHFERCWEEERNCSDRLE